MKNGSQRTKKNSYRIKKRKRPALYLNLSFSLSKKKFLPQKRHPLTSPQACTRDQKKQILKKVCGALSFPTTDIKIAQKEQKKTSKNNQKKI